MGSKSEEYCGSRLAPFNICSLQLTGVTPCCALPCYAVLCCAVPRCAVLCCVQVGVFDTAYHQTMPDTAFMYGLPYEWYTQHAIRRYGFHGTRSAAAAAAAAGLLQRLLPQQQQQQQQQQDEDGSACPTLCLLMYVYGMYAARQSFSHPLRLRHSFAALPTMMSAPCKGRLCYHISPSLALFTTTTIPLQSSPSHHLHCCCPSPPPPQSQVPC